jgi:glycosyltransferase involved in cell wall biosynthesis
LSVGATAAVVAAARALVLPVVSEASGLAAIDALAARVPVVASAIGCLPEIVGAGGIIVEPRDRDRLAAALAAMWADDVVRDGLIDALIERPAVRTWRDVATDVRSVYAEVGRQG